MNNTSQILDWSAQIQSELSIMVKVRNDINKQVTEYLQTWRTDNCVEHYGQLYNCIDSQTTILSSLSTLYGQRTIYLAAYYDKAVKSSTLVNENYEKLEECVEVIRTELREIIKKLCSFTTLEMDRYDKLLMVWNEHTGTSHGAAFYRDYEDYREQLNRIHRYDQVKLFGHNVCSMIDTLVHITTKMYSILHNKDNIVEISKLWQDNSRFQY